MRQSTKHRPARETLADPDGDRDPDAGTAGSLARAAADAALAALHWATGRITAAGTAAGESLVGTAAADQLSGRGGDDRLAGRGGNDTLRGGAGDDRLDGGPGNDRLAGDRGADHLLGRGGRDDLAGGGGKDALIGGGGADRLTGGGGNDRLLGGGGADRLTGGGGNDRLLGGAGDDVLVGGGGRDTLRAGGGDDLYIVDRGGEIVAAHRDPGIDTVSSPASHVLGPHQEHLVLTGSAALNGTGNRRANTLDGNAGDNVLHGAGGADRLRGGGGDDTLDGGEGVDRLEGGPGNDLYLVDAAGEIDRTRSDPGVDIVRTTVTYTLGPAQERLILAGAAAIDGTGSAGDDVVTGNRGDNRLDGAGGRDWLAGGDGDDVLVHDARDHAIDGGAGTDTLLVAGVGEVADLRAGSNGPVSDIEVVHFSGNGGQRLLVDAAGIIAQAPDSDLLVVTAASSGSVRTEDGWTLAGRIQSGGESFTEYTAGDATLRIGDLVVDRVRLAVLPLDRLAGDRGYTVRGVDAGDHSGVSVAVAGDVNGDGFDDLLIGADLVDAGDEDDVGAAYLVFGLVAGPGAFLDLAELEPAAGLRLTGAEANDYAGRSVSGAGDFNGDGFDDLLIGASRANPGGASTAGETYLVFGHGAAPMSDFELATLDGSDGMRLDGAAAGDRSASAVSRAGDLNGDGLDDLLIGAPLADPGGRVDAGAGYVVFGRTAPSGSSLALGDLDGADGFRIEGVSAGDRAAGAVAGAGDLNGDGFDDLVLGSYRADVGSGAYGGAAYVVFGRSGGFTSSLALADLDGGDGFRLDGAGAGDETGFAVGTAGDVNGDGVDDLLVGSPGAASGAGATHVVFGTTGGFAAALDLADLDGTDGFVIQGAADGDESGSAVGAAGDVNGDGVGDLIVGAPLADPGGRSGAGSGYLLFGRSDGFDAAVDLSRLDGSNGFALPGPTGSDRAGAAVAGSGDLDGDGFSDVVVGAFLADPGARNAAGESHVVLGDDLGHTIDVVTGDGDDVLAGGPGDEILIAGAGNDTLDGGGGADRLRGGAGDDRFTYDPSDRLVDGGGGRDTLIIDGSGIALDLGAIERGTLRHLETIDLTGTGDNRLTLGLADVLALDPQGNRLAVLGGAGDEVHLTETWTPAGNTDGQSVYLLGSATLLVDPDMDITFL